MPKETYEKLSYPALSPTMMCVPLADSTIQYPEGIVENLLVRVKNTFILVDFVVLGMEGDLRISLILGCPFLGNAKARIDVGTGKIIFRIMGKTMKFRFQNKKELFLIHEDSEKRGLWAEPGWEDWDINDPPANPEWEDWEIHDPPTEPAGEDWENHDSLAEPAWEDWEIHKLTPKDPAPVPPTMPKKTKKVCRKKKTSTSTTTSPCTDDSTLI